MSSLRDIKIEGKSNPAEFNIAQCLLADEWIDHEHPDIVKKAKELTDGIEDEWEKVIAIFEFIRDKIVYNFAPVIENATDWKASSVLKQKNGMCHQKSNLQVALFREVGIPAALTYQSVVDYPLLKLVLNRIANNFIRLLFLVKYNDVTNAFKAYKKELLENFTPIVSRHFNINVELALKAISRGYKYKVVPISWQNRKKNISKFKIKEMQKRYIFTIFYVWIEKILLQKDLKRD